MASIVGTGRSLPAECLSAEHLDDVHGLPQGFTASQTGVLTRYVCREESQIDLAVAACRAALQDANLSSEDVDLVLSGSSVPYQPIPTTAPLVMRELGMTDGSAAAFDVNSTCLSFLSAVQVAHQLLISGQHNIALVFSSEIASRGLPWKTHPDVAGLFGDGAAACILTKDVVPTEGIRSVLFRTYPSAFDASAIGAGGTRFSFHDEFEAFAQNSTFKMDGRSLFRLTREHFGPFVKDVLDNAGWTHQDVDLVIPHQASPAALEHMIRSTQFDPDRVINIVSNVGNQIAASLPYALDIARKDNRIKPGTKVLFLGTSAGVSFGGLAYEA